MWKCTFNNVTGLMIESQCVNAKDEVMIANANQLGFNDVSIRILTDDEHTVEIIKRNQI